MVGAHKPQYWKIIRLVAKYKYRDIPIKELRKKHCAFAWCPRCGEEIECKVENSNARQHMETCHPQVLRDYEAEQVMQVASQRGAVRALVSDFDGAKGQQQPKKLKAISELQQKQLINLLARWIAISLRPLALIEDVGFREIIKFIADLAAVELHLPGRTQVRDDIMRIAAELRLKLQEVLAKECLYFSLTTDTWTDRGQRSFRR
ncbi:hypothetical protein PHMEG_0009062 [Phytophthora megakarya]|uniref:BED-type domain-containing protein n=1 Tax=Phytophthora megakarya TaxID=4795 RepID=A0A225WJ56_9STRA|nr:hypothetical protein PHMEG_0009062 [Phytophthora megakarya]